MAAPKKNKNINSESKKVDVHDVESSNKNIEDVKDNKKERKLKENKKKTEIEKEELKKESLEKDSHQIKNTNVSKKQIELVNWGKHSFEPFDVIKNKSEDGCMNVCSKCLYVFNNKKSLDLHLKDNAKRCLAVTSDYFKIIYEQDFNFNESVEDEPVKKTKKTKTSTEYTHLGIARVNLLKNKQTLSMLGESFIRLKINYVDIQEYLFYALIDMQTKDILGFFSKNSLLNNSLSCIVIFPPFLRNGLGTFLIDFSQQVALNLKNENINSNVTNNLHKLHVENGPERPLSADAVFAYRSYWAYKTQGIKNIREGVTKYNMGVDDVILGLEENGFSFKKWKMIQKEGEEKKVNQPKKLLNCKLI